MELADLTWLTGLVDGEGSIIIGLLTSDKGINYFMPKLQIANDCLPLLEAVQARFGGSIGSWENKGKVHWRWTLSGVEKLKELVSAMLPYLIVKKEEARILVAYLDHRGTERAAGDCCWTYFRELRALHFKGPKQMSHEEVAALRSSHRARKQSLWTEEETRQLKNLIRAGLPLTQIAQKMGRSYDSISGKRRTTQWLDSVARKADD